VDPEDGGPYIYVPTTGKVLSYNQGLYHQQQIAHNLQRLVDQYFDAHQKYPDKLDDVVSMDRLSTDLQDPLGGTFIYNSKTHQVYSLPPDFAE